MASLSAVTGPYIKCLNLGSDPRLMKFVYILIFFFFLWIGNLAAVIKPPTTTWRMMAFNKRCFGALAYRTTYFIPKVRCLTACSQTVDCWSVNVYGGSDICELLIGHPCYENDPDLVGAPAWRYLKNDPPKKTRSDLNDAVLCPGAALVRYEQQYEDIDYDPSLPGYACTNHAWVRNEISAGRTNCIFMLVRGYDDVGNNINAYSGVVTSYDNALRNCLTYNCAGLTCVGARCWMKSDSYLSAGVNLELQTYNPYYWYIRCE